MANLDALRKIIREEVRAVFQQELAGILKEAIIANKGQQTITESSRPVKRPAIPATMNRSVPRPIAPILKPGNPLNSLLAETAQSMTMDEFGDLNGQGAERDVAIVESVEDMFANSRGSSNLEAIQINAVPDFTGVMAKMKANGEI
jgi:hypothetical protein